MLWRQLLKNPSIILWAIAAPAAALEPSDALKSACRADALLHCPGPIASYLVAKGAGEQEQMAIGACMRAHWADLSDSCREVSVRELHLRHCLLKAPFCRKGARPKRP
jgi:hypothetical protein